MNNISENLLVTLGLVSLGFLLGLFATAAAMDDHPRVMKDAQGLHVSHDDKLFRLVEIK